MYRSAPVEVIEKIISERDDSIKTLNAKVSITASVGGGKEGKVDTYTAFDGFIYVRKPSDLRVLLLLPVLRSTALDMVSDGKTFTLKHATPSSGDVWIQGTNMVTKPSKNGLENLRPQVFFDSLLVPGVPNEQFVSMTESTRILQSTEKKRVAIEEPDYDLTLSKVKKGNVLQTVRVIHMSRVNMLPFQQDIYDDSGKVVTSATYDKYQDFNGVQFPTLIVMNRPLDEYSLKVQVNKLTLNGTFEPDDFELKVPEGVTVKKME
jgi:outer membrane lipoprotein-sorting protein